MILPVLPTYYYLDHFTEMLCFVEETYGAVLGPEHHGFTKQFRALAMGEQCLFVRMLNRRGYIFDPAALKLAFSACFRSSTAMELASLKLAT